MLAALYQVINLVFVSVNISAFAGEVYGGW